MAAIVIIEAVVIVLLLILMAGLLKSHAEILRRLDSLGSRAEDGDERSAGQLRTTGLGEAPASVLSGVDPSGSTVQISLRHGRGETLLCFLSTGCVSCRVFWEELSAQPDLPTPQTRPVIVTKGTAAESPSKVAEMAPDRVSVVMSDEAWDVFKVPVTPYFMLVDGTGAVLGEGSANNMEHLLGLFQQAQTDSSPVRLSTRERETFTDGRLSRSGIEPGDESLYEDPLR